MAHVVICSRKQVEAYFVEGIAIFYWKIQMTITCLIFELQTVFWNIFIAFYQYTITQIEIYFLRQWMNNIPNKFTIVDVTVTFPFHIWNWCFAISFYK